MVHEMIKAVQNDGNIKKIDILLQLISNYEDGISINFINISVMMPFQLGIEIMR